MELKFLDSTGLSVLWAKIKSTFALASHKHNSTDITVSGSKQSLDGPLNDALDGLASDLASQDALVQKSLKSAAISLSDKKVTLTTTANDGTPGTSTFDLPTSAAGKDGLISHETVKQLAGEVAGSVYRVMGTKTGISEVLAIADAKVGDVWNVTTEFTLGGKHYPAGTNVVCITATSSAEGNDANWDALGGTVDLTPYAKTKDVSSTYATKTELSEGLGDKSDKSHTHTKSEITDFPTDLGDFTNSAGYLKKSETDEYYDAKGSASAVDSKLTSHTGNAAIHLPGGGSAGQVLKKTEGGSEWANEYRYTLPAAGDSLGGVKTGGDVTISAGVISISKLPESLIKAMTEEEIEGILV